jgi:hypothetical protein
VIAPVPKTILFVTDRKARKLLRTARPRPSLAWWPQPRASLRLPGGRLPPPPLPAHAGSDPPSAPLVGESAYPR